MMKRLLLALVLLWPTLAAAQDNVPVHSIPVGEGPGVIGWGSITPCVGIPYWSSTSLDPTCITSIPTSLLPVIPYVNLTPIPADNVLGNFTGSTAAPGPGAMTNCPTGAVTYNTSTHAFGCNSTATTAPWTNTRLAKTALYTALAADCGSTIALGGAAFYTLTFTAASGYTSNCVFYIVNEDTGRGKTIAINGLANFIQWPGQICMLFNDNNVWKTNCPYRWRFTGNLNIYLDPTGSDTNDGLATGAGGALQTIYQAGFFRAFNADQQGYTITANASAGLFQSTGGALHCATTAVGGDGTSQFLIKGVGVTTIITDTSTTVFEAFYGCVLRLESMRIIAPVATGVFADRGGRISIGTGVDFGGVSIDMLSANGAGSTILIENSPSISAGCGNAYLAANNGGTILHNGGVVNVTASFSCPYAANGNNLGNINVGSSSFNIGAFTWTGTKWALSNNSVISGAGTCATFFPPVTAGTTSTGSQCN